MEKEKKKGKGKIIAIIVTVMIIICIIIVGIFVGSKIIGNSNEKVTNSAIANNEINNKGTNNEKTTTNNNSQTENEVTTLSDSQLEQYIEQCFKARDGIDRKSIKKIEKYEEYETGKYIYLVYYYDKGDEYYETGNWIEVWLIDTTHSVNNPKVAWGAGTTADLFSNETIKEVKEDIKKNDILWKDYTKAVDNTTNRTTNSTIKQDNYQDDTYLKALAMKKWLDKDIIVSDFYNTTRCIYDGGITKNSDGSVSVHLKLYEEDIYEKCLIAHVSIEGAKRHETIIELTKEEATK